MSEYADKILAMTKEIERLRDALRPFGEIGRRLGWVDMADDDPHLGDHIMTLRPMTSRRERSTASWSATSGMLPRSRMETEGARHD
jgi:hypothetical protein